MSSQIKRPPVSWWPHFFALKCLLNISVSLDIDCFIITTPGSFGDLTVRHQLLLEQVAWLADRLAAAKWATARPFQAIALGEHKAAAPALSRQNAQPGCFPMQALADMHEVGVDLALCHSDLLRDLPGGQRIMMEEGDYTLPQGVFTLGGNWSLLRLHRLRQKVKF
jgi:hypothetical protein